MYTTSTYTHTHTHTCLERDIRECLAGNFVRLFPLFCFSAFPTLTQVGSQASWTRAKFYNFPLKVSPPPFPAPPPIYTLAPAKQLTHISVSAYATKWPKVAAIDGLVISYDFVSFFFLFPAPPLNFAPRFYCCHRSFCCARLQPASTRRKQTHQPPRFSFLANGRDSSNRRNRRLRVDWN